MEIRRVNIFYYFIDRNKRSTEKNCIPFQTDTIQRTNNEIIEIDDKQVSPRYTIDIYLSSTYVLTSLPNLLFHRIYRLSRHRVTRTFTGKHLFFSTRSSSANHHHHHHHHRSFRNSISSPGICQKRLQSTITMFRYNVQRFKEDYSKLQIVSRTANFLKEKERKVEGGGGGGMRREQVEKYRYRSNYRSLVSKRVIK